MQYLFLQQTSAASLAVSNIAIQVLLSFLDVALLGTPPTLLLVSGVALTVTATACYAWLKLRTPPAAAPLIKPGGHARVSPPPDSYAGDKRVIST